KHHPEAEGGIGGILLHHAQLAARVRFLEQVGEIEPGGTRAGDEDLHYPQILRAASTQSSACATSSASRGQAANSATSCSRSQWLPASASKRSCQCTPTSAGGIGTGGGSALKLPRFS